MGKIDFVVLWVDGADINWLNEKKQYDKSIVDASSCAARFRDWDNMQYWFRGVEKFAPWVNQIYFVTWGHTPTWLNLEHPKLKIINHRDFIPHKYLPTYNSNAIELNLHRIPELSEHFVLFNDDMFLIKPVNERDFFVDGKPCDVFIMNAIIPYPKVPIIAHTSVNNVMTINKHFKKRQVTKQIFPKVFSPKYGSGMFRNALLSVWTEFTGFYNTHIPLSHLKSTFGIVWEKEGELLDQTCGSRFRQYTDVSHWLMRYWNMCSGNFVPRKAGFGKLFTVSNKNEEAVQYIARQKGSVVCINDSVADFDFEKAVKEVNQAFESILSKKSSFEL